VDPDESTLPFSPPSHDGFVKAVFSQPEQAIAFFKSHLPAPIAARADWSSLTVLPSSFVKSSLAQVHSDLLFSVNLGGHPSLLYLLFEHQSSPDPAMPLRLLAYVSEILFQHHKTKGFPLPPVLPFVLHQGPDAWNISPHFQDLFDLPDELAPDLLPYLPKFQHALLDLSRYEPATAEADTQLRIVLQLMKLVRQRELLRFFTWFAQFPAHSLPENLLTLMLLYALTTDSELDVERVYHTLSSNPELKSSTMSIAEKLQTKGRVVGKIQTLEEFLDLPVTPDAVLDALSPGELEARHAELRQAYETRFKGR
jgi:predicted transposase/invertase (TIGR01784 family)